MVTAAFQVSSCLQRCGYCYILLSVVAVWISILKSLGLVLYMQKSTQICTDHLELFCFSCMASAAVAACLSVGTDLSVLSTLTCLGEQAG